MAHRGIVSRTAGSQTQSFNLKLEDLILHGDANPILRLTKTDASGQPVPNSSGKAYASPIDFLEPGGFKTTVKFLIKSVDNNPGKRLIFFIAPVGTNLTTLRGQNSSIFAVEFIEKANNGDQINGRISIDIPYPIQVETVDVGDALLNQEVTAVIQYVEAQKKITVRATTSTSSAGPFNLSYTYDLKKLLPQKVEVGLVAFTEEAVAIHDVIAWSFSTKLGDVE